MEALGKWYGKMPKEVEQNIHSLAPMLSQLGKWKSISLDSMVFVWLMDFSLSISPFNLNRN